MAVRLLLILSALALIQTDALTGEPKKDDAKTIQGTWKLVAVEGPDKIPAEELKKLRIRITADRLVIESEGKEIHSPKFKLDPSKKPKEIDLVVQVLIDKKAFVVRDFQPRQGIYELNGDDLKICVAWVTSKMTPDPSMRPKELKTGGDLTVMTLKREK